MVITELAKGGAVLSQKARKLGDFDREFVLRAAKEAYELGQAPFEFGPKGTALIIVDMLEEFVRPNYTPYWIPAATEAVPKIKELIKVCRAKNVPVIYTAYHFHEDGIDLPRGAQYIPIYQGDIELAGQIFNKPSVYSEIAPEPKDMVILKPTYDAFFGTKLDLVLRNMGIGTVIICGTMTNYCCAATAKSAFMLGYNVVFGSDINATDFPEMQEAELKTLRRGFAKIMTADEIMAKLR
ncbi:MAG: cysteine hydrolase [Bacillota bacterium]|nr:MAG: cysteine hydrolase [Bacillota bacterium]